MMWIFSKYLQSRHRAGKGTIVFVRTISKELSHLTDSFDNVDVTASASFKWLSVNGANNSDGYRETNKVKQVRKWIENGSNIKILSPDEFIE